MSDSTTRVADLKEAVARFVRERDWEQFHNPKNLAMALSVEAAELMEHFLWIDGEASRGIVHDPAQLEQVADELADVTCLVLNLCNSLGLDLSVAFTRKLARNAQKYPADRCRGRYKAEG
jgi:NTP pyrophosphatase (non-canonical NTP hydrolase)